MKGLYATPTGEATQTRHLAGLLVLLGTIFSLVLLTIPASAEQATKGSLETVEGNPDCGDFTQGGIEFKIPPDGTPGEIQDIYPGASFHTDGVLEVNLFTRVTGDGPEFDFTTNFPVDVIVVKGGPNANVYTYNPVDSSDFHLHSPFNDGSQMWYGLSHISFCYFEPVTTTTPPTTAPTTTPPTTAPTTTPPTTAPTTTPPTTPPPPPDEILPEVVTTTTVAPTTTTTVAVAPVTLPFTGPRSGALIPFAVSLLAAGLLVVLGARRIED
ncbi:MAG: hypothetical protein IH943_07070 [Acidobacteria bacterium]|nr:hypothetical protein [Acidobacteriota bacterium]